MLSLVATFALTATVVSGAPPAAAAAIAVEDVPYAMDSSNQAGWWQPIVQSSAGAFLAFDAPSQDENTHEVHVALRAPAGGWSAGCLQLLTGACAAYLDDPGHNQPSIVIDGDGYVHVFASMHNHTMQYFRSSTPYSVTDIVERPTEIPDPVMRYTYPIPTVTPDGDVLLMLRSSASTSEPDLAGQLYRWSNSDDAWSHIAKFALEPGWTPYPDDIRVDADGLVHIILEWADGGASGLRYFGSYFTYDPTTEVWADAAGTALTLPIGLGDAQVQYESRSGLVQSASLALENETGDVSGIAYRYQGETDPAYQVRWAEWVDGAWVTAPVTADIFSNPAAIAATSHDGVDRVYYVRPNDCTKPTISTDGGLMVATRTDGGAWQERYVGGGDDVSRFQVRGTPEGTDHLYLVAARDNLPLPPTLRYGSLSAPQIADLEPLEDVVVDPVVDSPNLALGAEVTATSLYNDVAIPQCVVDGDPYGVDSRWIGSTEDQAPALTLELAGGAAPVSEIHVWSGNAGVGAEVSRFWVDARIDGEWVQIAAAVNSPKQKQAVAFLASPVTTDALRVRFPAGIQRIFEIEAYSEPTADRVTVTATTEPGYALFAGDEVELDLRLRNRGPVVENVTGTLTLPPEWGGGQVPFSARLQPGTSTVSTAVAAPEPGTPAGTYHASVAIDGASTTYDVPLVFRDGMIQALDGAPVVTETGTWFTSSLVGYGGIQSRWTHGESGATITVTPTLPQAGTYRVSVYNPATDDTTTAAAYTVTSADGDTSIAVDQIATALSWHELGVFTFDAGATGSLTLTATAAGYHRVGAVRFEYVPPAPAWQADLVYRVGDEVTVDGTLYRAAWWTQGQMPGDPWGPWQEIAPTSGGVAEWTASRIYTAGDRVEHDGVTYVAQWWTRNQPPGDADGPWALTT